MRHKVENPSTFPRSQVDVASLPVLDRQARLGDLAYEALRDKLMAGGFQPGQKLTVRAVAEALGVSTTPARDALNRLIADGNLVNEGPKTVVVPYLDQRTIDEVTAIRLSLEGLAADRAAGHLSEADLIHLEELQAQINAGLNSAEYTAVLDANRQFHFLIYERSGMPRLVAMIESLWLRIGPSLNALYPDFATNRKGVSNHLRVMTALKANHGAEARAAIEQDIHDGYARLSRYVAERVAPVSSGRRP